MCSIVLSNLTFVNKIKTLPQAKHLTSGLVNRTPFAVLHVSGFLLRSFRFAIRVLRGIQQVCDWHTVICDAEVANMQQWRPGERSNQLGYQALIIGRPNDSRGIEQCTDSQDESDHIAEDSVLPQVNVELHVRWQFDGFVPRVCCTACHE